MSQSENEKFRRKLQSESHRLSDAFFGVAETISGPSVFRNMHSYQSVSACRALNEILRYFHKQETADAFDGASLTEFIKFQLKDKDLDYRTVELKDNWLQDGIEPCLAKRQDGSYIAFLPAGLGHYVYQGEDGKRHRVTPEIAADVEPEAICFFRLFPDRPMGSAALFGFLLQSVSPADLLFTLAMTVLVVVVSMIIPRGTQSLLYNAMDYDSLTPVIAMFMLLFSATVSIALFRMLKEQIMNRILIKCESAVRQASLLRVLQLPNRFFQGYSPGDISARVEMIHAFCTAIVEGVLSNGLLLVISLFYLVQIWLIAPGMGPVMTMITAVSLAFSAQLIYVSNKITERQMLKTTEERGLLFSELNGVEKIKLACAEKRYYTRWLEVYKDIARLNYRLPQIMKYSPVYYLAITLVGSALIYRTAQISSTVESTRFLAVMSCYGMLTNSMLAFQNMIPQISKIDAIYGLIRPILYAEPEKKSGGRIVTSLKGNIQLSGVRFRYDPNSPLVLDGLDLEIRSGEYVAVVGRSGCGKSTLFRLLLGFEEPETGAVLYDGMELRNLDRHSVRQHMGVVLQDSRLFSGSIFSNIAIANPGMTMDEAWKAAELAGIADDIRAMPMEMNTFIDENAGTISGGQRQRIVIARALASHPDILLFDEATSALDNLTQKIVTESLDALKCTRVVIAHRLSTIRNCDRIIMLGNGKILEEGTYDELIRKNGEFAAMVKRQRIEE